MESQPKNPEFKNNPESFHPCTLAMLLDNFLQGFLPIKAHTSLFSYRDQLEY